jgi:hypothetical protein
MDASRPTPHGRVGNGRLGIAPHVIEACLNHQSDVIRGVAAVYNRCRYEPEKREALSAWAAHVANLIPAPAIGLPLAA